MSNFKALPIKTRCWYCGAENNRTVSIVETASPNDGDLSFCFHCGHFAIWDSSLTDGIRKPDPSENDWLKANKEAKRMIMLWALANAETKQD